MKRKLKILLLSLPGFEALCRALTRRHVRALMYHRFCATPDGPSRHMDKDTLQAQVDYIRRHHETISPEQHLQAIQGKVHFSNAVVVTCDDGYADFHDIAYPIFRETGIPAMLFVTTGFVAGTNWFWWDKIAYVIDAAPSAKFCLKIEGEEIVLDLTSPAGRELAWNRIADRCRFLKDHQKNKVFGDLATEAGIDLPDLAPGDFAPSSWKQIQQMADDGILMGAHTVTHPILTRVDLDRVEAELSGSRRILEEQIDRPVPFFCYPQGGPGDYNEEVRELTAKYFTASYLAYQMMERTADPFTMPRYGISRDMMEFRWFLCGAEYLGLQLRRRLGLRTGVGAGYWSGSHPAKEVA